MSHFRTVGNRIGAKSAPRMAAGEPVDRQPRPAPGAMPFDGDGRVLRTAGHVPARREPAAPSQLVEPDEAKKATRRESPVGGVGATRGDGVTSEQGVRVADGGHGVLFWRRAAWVLAASIAWVVIDQSRWKLIGSDEGATPIR